MASHSQVPPTESPHQETQSRKPLALTGALGGCRYEETTPLIGREYFEVDIVKDILDSEDADARIRDLAITSM
ncbi:Alpha-ketoglutarate-dependent sulfonate dioxygenase [Venturia nashicola]|nr:Alpha-ketoglutarate-dependent sulfonate dioxygenase [Venturia nashicola]